jgi:hypothetical protein
MCNAKACRLLLVELLAQPWAPGGPREIYEITLGMRFQFRNFPRARAEGNLTKFS